MSEVDNRKSTSYGSVIEMEYLSDFKTYDLKTGKLIMQMFKWKVRRISLQFDYPLYTNTKAVRVTRTYVAVYLRVKENNK